MNRMLLFLAFVFAAINGMNSQIVLDADDAPAVGDEFIYASDTTVAELGPGPDGADQTWSFSGLDIHTIDTTQVLDPTTVDPDVIFPEATAALTTMGFNAFVQLTDTALFNLGAIGDVLGLGQELTVVFDPPQQVLAVPSTFGASFTDQYGFQVLGVGADVGFPDLDSIRVTSTTTVTSEIDAYGTLELNGESFEVLRQHNLSNNTMIIEIIFLGSWLPVSTMENNTEDYQWLSEEAKGPVFTLNYDEAGDPTPSGATYLSDGEPVVIAPTAAFSFEDQGAGQVTFTDLSANAPTEWLWDFGDGNTSTDQNPSYAYTADGNYTVCLTVTNSAGSDEACQEVPIMLTSTGEATASDGIRLYPNPAVDQFRIELQNGSTQPLRLTIIDSRGQIVKQETMRAYQSIDTGNWAGGTYLYLLQDLKGRLVAAGKLQIAR